MNIKSKPLSKFCPVLSPYWYLQAEPGTKRGQQVVMVATAPDGFILTADLDYARLRNATPDQLAKDLATKIRTTIGGKRSNRSLEKPQQQREAEAADKRAAGDDAYARNEKKEAERLYREGLEISARHFPLYERLLALYKELGNKASYDEILQKGLAQPFTPQQLNALKNP